MTKKKLTEDELKERYMKFKAIQEQIENFSQQSEILNQNNADLEMSKEVIEELSKTKKDTEILAPIANGVFMKTNLGDNQKLLINVGSDTVIEKNVPEVLKLLEEQKKEMTLKVVQVQAVLGELQKEAMKIYQEIEEYVE